MSDEISVETIPFSSIERTELEQLRTIAWDAANSGSNDAEIAAWRMLAESALAVLGVSLNED